MIEIEFQGNWAKLFLGGLGLTGGPNDDIVEAHISNRQKHAVIAEFGSGIYAEGSNAKGGRIFPKKSGALIIPISTKYSKKLKPAILLEAKENAQRHPEILSRVKSQMPGVIGFIFRDSIKGMRPIRMVRDSIPKVEQFLNNELQKIMSSQQPSRAGIVAAVNSSAALWLREIIKNSPVLTSNMKTGWTISRLAK